MDKTFFPEDIKKIFKESLKHSLIIEKDNRLSDKELEIETLMAYDALDFYKTYKKLGAKQIIQLWDGIILGLEIARGRLESIQEIYFGMRYDEYYLRTVKFFISTFFNEYKIRSVRYAD